MVSFNQRVSCGSKNRGSFVTYFTPKPIFFFSLLNNSFFFFICCFSLHFCTGIELFLLPVYRQGRSVRLLILVYMHIYLFIFMSTVLRFLCIHRRYTYLYPTGKNLIDGTEKKSLKIPLLLL